MMSKESCKMDMCNGPVLQKVIAFSLPLMLSSCLQLLFNAADVSWLPVLPEVLPWQL